MIDTLRFADRLKDAGFEAPHAEGKSRALGDEFAERVLAEDHLDAQLRPIHRTLRDIHARFKGVDAGFEALDVGIEPAMGRFNVSMTMVGLGFALLTGLVAFSAIAPGVAHATQQQTAPVGAEEGAQASVPEPSEPAAIH